MAGVKRRRPMHMSMALRVLGTAMAMACECAHGHAALPQPHPLPTQLPVECDMRFDAAFTSSLFPANFSFGTATSSYQVEGAAFDGGRGLSVWDVYASIPGNIADNSTGAIASNEYYKYMEDIKLMKALGTTTYRFSISWPRILPLGTGTINPIGIAYYNALINALLSEGITPAVTLSHWDLPEYLHETMGGWLNASIADYFLEYANICFQSFGDRVKIWTTFNEPTTVAVEGYANGDMAPGRCSNLTLCPGGGNSSTEPYIVGHNMLRSHAVAAQLYRSKYQPQQKGRLGISLESTFFYPLTDSQEDIAASERGLLFSYGWFADPIMVGDYPAVMKELVGDRLPSFTEVEKNLLKGSVDFLGLNFYSARYVTAGGPPPPQEASPATDSEILSQETDRYGTLIGALSASVWLLVVPKGIYSMVMWITSRYNGFPMLITENGVSQPGNSSIPLSTALCDLPRVMFYESYLKEVLRAIQEGANVQAYYAWSLLDNWEWSQGFSQRFGIYYVDFTKSSRPRYPKLSAFWWSYFLRTP